MKNILKKAILVGVGAGALTKETAEKAYKDLQNELKKGEYSAAKGKKFVNKLLADSCKERKRIMKLAEKELKRAIRQTGINKTNISMAKKALTSIEKMVAGEKKKAHGKRGKKRK